MIHRAVCGSLERFVGVLTEHLAGKWPLWLSPRQVALLPISDEQVPYAEQIARELNEAGLDVVVDRSTVSLKKKIRTAQLAQFNFFAVIGQAEVAGGTVSLRTRDQATSETMPVGAFKQHLADLVRAHK
eukprot:m.647611 g.647611  ORF g.647611 m.647611 type:complete len:129 (+) comp58375_c0_seq4:165-551(+)